jgi:DNA-binding PadR family transcriptional regulator
MGQIREEDGGSGRKTFAITEEGTKVLAENRAQVEALMARLAALGATREKTDAAPVRRAMGNLRAVLLHRLGEGKLSGETLHAVTAIIDDAAQRIERL